MILIAGQASRMWAVEDSYSRTVRSWSKSSPSLHGLLLPRPTWPTLLWKLTKLPLLSHWSGLIYSSRIHNGNKFYFKPCCWPMLCLKYWIYMKNRYYDYYCINLKSRQHKAVREWKPLSVRRTESTEENP